eukprot:SM000230S07331  [mRNA]  locus=s230:2545:20707:+ [translate_table: standard]
MFEGLVHQLVAGYLGHYFSGVQKEQLRIGLWSGIVLLENVELSLEAFEHLELPFAIKIARVGKLRLQVPWKKLGWEPLVVSMEHVTICAGPREEAETQVRYSGKQVRLKREHKKQSVPSWQQPSSLSSPAVFQACTSQVEPLLLALWPDAEDRSGLSYISYLSAKIIDNVQVSVSSIHLRYEDFQTNPERPFIVGLTLESFLVKTTDAITSRSSLSSSGSSSPSPSGIKKSQRGVVHKRMSIQKLAVYWDSDAKMLSCNEQGHMDAADGGEEHAFILQPLDAGLDLTISKNPGQADGSPQYDIQVAVNDVALALNDHQFLDMQLLAGVMSIYQVRKRFGRYRPKRADGASMHWRKWWQYAAEAVLVDVKQRLKRSSWGYLAWRMEKQKDYVAVYKRKLCCVRQGQLLKADEIKKLEVLEEELDADDILFFRSLAEAQLHVKSSKEGPEEAQKSIPESGTAQHPKQRGWLDWLSLGMLGSSMTANDFTGAITQADLEDLYAATQFVPSPLEEQSYYSKGFCVAAVSIQVAEAIGSLRSSALKYSLVDARLMDVRVTVMVWGKSVTLTGTLGSLEAVDLCSFGTLFPCIFGAQKHAASAEAGSESLLDDMASCIHRSMSFTSASAASQSATEMPLLRSKSGAFLPPSVVCSPTTSFLQLHCQIAPEDSNVDIDIKVSLQPLQIVYSPELVRQAARFFSHRTSVPTHHQLVVAALNGLETLRARTLSKAEYVIATHKRVSIQVDIDSTCLVIPECSTAPHGLLLAVSFGSIHFASAADPPAQARMSLDAATREACIHPGDKFRKISQDSSLHLLEEAALYDHYRLIVANLQVIMAKQDEDWHAMLRSQEVDHKRHLLQPLSLQLTLDMCALQNDKTLTKLKVGGTTSELNLPLSLAKCQALGKLFSNLGKHVTSKDKSTSSGGACSLPATFTKSSAVQMTEADRLRPCDESESLVASRQVTNTTVSSSDTTTSGTSFIHTVIPQQDRSESLTSMRVRRRSNGEASTSGQLPFNECSGPANLEQSEAALVDLVLVVELVVVRWSPGEHTGPLRASPPTLVARGSDCCLRYFQKNSKTVQKNNEINSSAEYNGTPTHNAGATWKIMAPDFKLVIPEADRFSHQTEADSFQLRPTNLLGEVTLSRCYVITMNFSGTVEQSAGRLELDTSFDANVVGSQTMLKGIDGKEQDFQMPLLQASRVQLTCLIMKLPRSSKTSQGHDSSHEAASASNLTIKFDGGIGDVQGWCSHQILKFVSSFELEHLRRAPFSLKDGTEISAQFHVEKLSYHLGDSRWKFDAPILDCCLRGLQISGQLLDLEATACVMMELSLNYHNTHKAAWEPAVEPWLLQAAAVWALEALHPVSVSKSSYSLTSTAMLNCNITPAMAQAWLLCHQLNLQISLQAMKRAVEILQESGQIVIDKTLASSHPSPSHEGSRTKTPFTSDVTSSDLYTPYSLRNLTGEVMRYWLLSNGSEAYQPGSSATSGSLLPGMDVPLWFDGMEELQTDQDIERRDAQKKRQRVRHRCISIQLDGMSLPSSPISVELVGTWAFLASMAGLKAGSEKGSAGDLATHYTSSSNSHAGEDGRMWSSYSDLTMLEPKDNLTHFESVRHLVSLQNATMVPLEIRFDIPIAPNPTVMAPVPPGKVMHIPVHLAETGDMRWRPRGSGHQWSEKQQLPKLLQHSGPARTVTCTKSSPGGAPLRFCIDISQETLNVLPAEGARDRRAAPIRHNSARREELIPFTRPVGRAAHFQQPTSCSMWTITVRPPLLIRNHLPCQFKVSIFGQGGVVAVHELRIIQGALAHIYEVDAVHDLQMCFELEGFERSGSVHLPRASVLSAEAGLNSVDHNDCTLPPASVFLQPISATGLPLSLALQWTVNAACGARQMAVAAPFLLYNATSLPLSVTDGERDVALGSVAQILLGSRQEATPSERFKCGDFTPQSLTSVTNPSAARPRGLLDALPGLDDLDWSQGAPVEGPAEKGAPSEGTTLLRSMTLPTRFADTADVQSSLGLASASAGHLSDMEALQLTKRLRDQLAKDSKEVGLYSPPKRREQREPCLKLGHQGMWSEAMPLEPPGAVAVVSIPQRRGHGAHILALSVTHPVDLPLTKILTFQPRFVLVNGMGVDVCYRQQGTDTFLRLPAGYHKPLHWTNIQRSCKLKFIGNSPDPGPHRSLLVCTRIDEHGWDWSGGFAPDKLGDTQLKLRNVVTGQIHMARVNVSTPKPNDGALAEPASQSVNRSGTCIILMTQDETQFMPYRIENLSTETLIFYQQRCETSRDTLRPYSSCLYAWDEPCLPHRLVLKVRGATLGTYQLDEVKQHGQTTLAATAQRPERHLQVSISSEGPTRVLKVMDLDIHVVEDNLEVASFSNRYQKAIAAGIVPPSLPFSESEVNITLDKIGISIIDSTPQLLHEGTYNTQLYLQEIVYASVQGLSCCYQRGHLQQLLDVQVQALQVDNQLQFATFPVLLSSVPTAGAFATLGSFGVSENVKSVAALSILAIKWRQPVGLVDCFQDICITLAPLRLELEECLFLRLLDVMHHILALNRRQETLIEARASDHELPVMASSMTSPSPTRSTGHSLGRLAGTRANSDSDLPALGSKAEAKETAQSAADKHKVAAAEHGIYYAENVARTITTLSTGELPQYLRARGDGDVMITLPPNRRKVYVEKVQVARVDILFSFCSEPWLQQQTRGAAWSLLESAGFVLQRRMLALADVEEASVHLKVLTLRHPLGSLEALRDMVGRHYMRQLLQVSYQILGSADFLGNPINFLGTLGSGLWDFLAFPVVGLARSPQEFRHGVTKGTRSLVNKTIFAFSNAAARMSGAAKKGVAALALDHQLESNVVDTSIFNVFLEALTGALELPVRGAEQNGIPGMLKGAAVGLLGLAAKPAASLLELATRTAHSIRNSTQPLNSRPRQARPPRHLSADSQLELYSWEEALGQAVLLEALNGRLQEEVYVTCKPLQEDSTVALLTRERLLCVKSLLSGHLPLGPEWQVQWEAELLDFLQLNQVGSQLTALVMMPISIWGEASRTTALTRRVVPWRSSPLGVWIFDFMDEEAASSFQASIQWALSNAEHSQGVLTSRARFARFGGRFAAAHAALP